MRRRGILVAASTIAALSGSAAAQTRRRTAQVGSLGVRTDPSRLEQMREVLRVHGFEEARNLVIHVRSAAEGDHGHMQALAAELVALGVDVIRAYGDTASRAARVVTNSVPIVISIAGDPVARGFAESVGRPGRNITGTSSQDSELMAKRLELLVDAFPAGTRAGVTYHGRVTAQLETLRRAQQAAQRLGIELLPREVNAPADYEPAAAAFAAAGATVLVPVGDAMLVIDPTMAAEAARRHRLPSIFFGRNAAEAGGLMSLGINLRSWARVTAEYVARILKGEKPGDMPFYLMDRFELVINLRTAREIGVTLPALVLARADEVIE